MAGEEALERLAAAPPGMKSREQPRNGLGHFVGRAAKANGTRDRSDLSDTSADAEVVGVDHFSVDFGFLALDADVSDPVLSARVGAAGNVQTNVLLIVGQTLFKLLGKPAGEGLRFGKREFAEFRTSAGNRAASERRRHDRQAGGRQLCDYGRDVQPADIDEEEILHRSGTNVAVAVALREIGSNPKLRRCDPAANDISANGKEARLLLRSNTKMIAVNVGR